MTPPREHLRAPAVTRLGLTLHVLIRRLRLVLHVLGGLGGRLLDLRALPGALLRMVLDLAARVEGLVLERLGGGSERVGRPSAFRRHIRALLLA
jgi:hypothetical protein